MDIEGQANFECGAAMVRPYLHLNGQVAIAVDENLDKGITLLESCSENLWEANWLLGKAYEAKGWYLESVRRFELAFQLEPRRVAVVHELIISYLRVKENKKAIQIASQFASSSEPLLIFDLALVESTFSERQHHALRILDSFTWPIEFSDRVAALRGKITA